MGGDPITLIHERFRQMSERFPDRDFVATPPNPERHYAPEGITRTYADANRRVGELEAIYRDAGLGHGHRVGLQVENHPNFYLHRMALHRLGTTLVPLNQDHVAKEIEHVFKVTRPELAITFDRHRPRIDEAAAALGSVGPHVVSFDAFERGAALPGARNKAPLARAIDENTETTILFTSGTTGHPKGCRFTHSYESMACDWYCSRGGHVTYRDGVERLYSPLPLHHSNTGVHAFLEMLATGGCLVTSDRFRSNRYWQEVKDARATCIHYLGVIMAMLYQMPVTDEERSHTVRFGLGAGLEPSLHAKFEERFGFPLVELWGMTEIMRFLCDSREPRKVGTRAFGRSEPGLEAKLVDEEDKDVGDDTPGELVVRHSAETPRAGFFDGYLGEPEATEHGWRGGWFHTGDVAVRDTDGVFHFVDRKKHIIRRAGQNIAAAEIETVMLSHPQVREVAAVAVKDEIREEEVFLCVVRNDGAHGDGGGDRALAEAIFDHAITNLAHYKAPGFVLFVDSLPRTASQKMMKYAIFAEGVDPRKLDGVHDLRERKKQAAAGARARS